MIKKAFLLESINKYVQVIFLQNYYTIIYYYIVIRIHMQ